MLSLSSGYFNNYVYYYFFILGIIFIYNWERTYWKDDWFVQKVQPLFLEAMLCNVISNFCTYSFVIYFSYEYGLLRLAEFGDYSDTEHGESYLDGFQFVPSQTTSLVKKIVELHQLHK